ncbi:helix-turn-helix domain-containing protein [Chryseobacterium suipulveris]|uniref:Helix-turn-helix domain-containing protein n=1 Tax=Chryseobacterium suipulveris TaxID=2929800 RepID=A0ABY4BLA0_9FLAO|nr:helix-turn-helix transcriptional regulator [Chryseobacterium suipulveris]UOE39950.1 helix-turn-helix domain-containing protein [Chryseobacterium suipulveris]
MKINRLKVVLAEKEKTNKWLAEHLGKSEVTVSRWVTNDNQPSMETLLEIAKLLDVDIKDLLNSSKVVL